MQGRALGTSEELGLGAGSLQGGWCCSGSERSAWEGGAGLSTFTLEGTKYSTKCHWVH